MRKHSTQNCWRFRERIDAAELAGFLEHHSLDAFITGQNLQTRSSSFLFALALMIASDVLESILVDLLGMIVVRSAPIGAFGDGSLHNRRMDESGLRLRSAGSDGRRWF